MSPPILWAQVWGLAAVQGAISLTWVIYNLYLGRLLTQLGLPETLANSLLILENLLSIILEPLMGSLSDQAQQWVGSRFPMISAGVILSSALFIAIPGMVVLEAKTTAPLGWILVVLLVSWALAMTIFRSPALALLGRYASAVRLPQAASILTLVSSAVGAIRPLTHGWILNLGPALTFTIGSLVLLGATALLRTMNPNAIVAPDSTQPSAKATEWRFWIGNLALSFGVGMGITVGYRFLFKALPALLEQTIAPDQVRGLLGLISIVTVVTAIPAGMLANRWGHQTAMLVGMGGMAVGLLLAMGASTVTIAGILALLIGSVSSLISNGSLPFALSLAPPQKAGLGIGLYFSGAGLGSSLFLQHVGQLSPSQGLWWGAGCFVITSGLVSLASLPRRDSEPTAPS